MTYPFKDWFLNSFYDRLYYISIGNLKQLKRSERNLTKPEVFMILSKLLRSMPRVVTRGQDQSIVLNYLKVKCKSVTPTAKQINVVIYY